MAWTAAFISELLSACINAFSCAHCAIASALEWDALDGKTVPNDCCCPDMVPFTGTNIGSPTRPIEVTVEEKDEEKVGSVVEVAELSYGEENITDSNGVVPKFEGQKLA